MPEMSIFRTGYHICEMLCEMSPLCSLSTRLQADVLCGYIRWAQRALKHHAALLLLIAILLADGVGRLILYVAWANTTDGQTIWAIMDGRNVW